MPKSAILVTCDFDGTITRQDTLVEVLDSYGSSHWRQIQDRVVSGNLSIREGLEAEMGSVRATLEQIREVLERVEIEPTFPPFLRSMRKGGIPVVLLSGGFDLFVEMVLRKEKLWPLPVLANRLIRTNGCWHVEFPFPSTRCSACGHCKADPIRSWNSQGYLTAFIGNGVTDRCAVREARISFAKDELYLWCQKEAVPAQSFRGFHEVEEKLKTQGWL